MVSSPVEEVEVEAEEQQQSSMDVDTTAIPSHSEPQQSDHKQHDIHMQDPNPTELPPPHCETLDPPNPNQSDNKQLDENKNHTIVVENDQTQLPPPPRMTSPRPRQNNKRKKGNFFKRKSSMKKMNNLTAILNPKPFRPTIALNSVKHEDVLKRLGLYEFSKIEFDRTVRKDYIVQFIVNYDAKKRCSFVNDTRIVVTRAALAKTLKLPVKVEKGTSNVDEVDLDSEVFSDEAIGFIEDFVMNWMLLGEMPLVMPTEIENWTRCIRDGHPEKLDSASLIWYRVERELAQGDKLTDCYYASHLQYLIRANRPELFVDSDDDVADDVCEEITTKVDDVADNDCEEITKVDDVVDNDCEETVKIGDVVDNECEEITKVDDVVDNDCEETVKIGDGVDNDCEEVTKVDDEREDKEEKDEKEKDEENEKEEEDEKNENEKKEEKGEKVEDEEKYENLGKVSLVEEHDIELTLGPDVEEFVHEGVKKDDEIMVDDEEVKAAEEEEEVEEREKWDLGGKNILGDHYLQRCENSDLNSLEERQVEKGEDEQLEQLDCEDVEEEEEGGERLDEGFDMEANDSMDRDGLADNYLQGMETSHIPYNNSHGMSSMDLFGSRDETFMSHGGPSFFNNGGKRVMEPDEEDLHHHDRYNKRLKSSDLGYCFEQMQQWMEKAKMVIESKEQSFTNSQYSQQYELNQLQERHNLLEDMIKSKDEELQKKHTEVFRLERELYLVGDIVKGYKKALDVTRFKFDEYRKKHVLFEEPLYKDAGPGGLVLSTELEKQRLKQEEDKMKFMMVAKNLEDQSLYVLKMHDDKVSMLGDKLMSIENEVKRLRESFLQSKETQKGQDEHEQLADEHEDNQKSIGQQLTAEHEENQKSIGQQLTAEPEQNQESVDKHELTAELEDNKKSVDEHQSTAEVEDVHKSVGEQGFTAELEDNKKSVDEHQLTAELEDVQKSVGEQECTAELADNLKSVDEQESAAELEDSQKSLDEVLVIDATVESAPLDADELKEKVDGEN
ncbi:uncharacterized protein [Rutidosis leptorrhynchoides]|uniref:uncharacterized protein n=1 Tax=Rutidosis leptorrhynchoides TaxID=125765 RepID=UPI003A992A98